MSILKVNDFWRSGEKYIATSRYKSLVLYQIRSRIRHKF